MAEVALFSFSLSGPYVGWTMALECGLLSMDVVSEMRRNHRIASSFCGNQVHTKLASNTAGVED